MNLDDLSAQLHETARNKGFWDGDFTITFMLSKLALIHSEVSETLEAIRKEKGSQVVVEELADILIRTLDLYAGMFENEYVTESLEEVLQAKARYNTLRQRMHGVLA